MNRVWDSRCWYWYWRAGSPGAGRGCYSCNGASRLRAAEIGMVGSSQPLYHHGGPFQWSWAYAFVGFLPSSLFLSLSLPHVSNPASALARLSSLPPSNTLPNKFHSTHANAQPTSPQALSTTGCLHYRRSLRVNYSRHTSFFR